MTTMLRSSRDSALLVLLSAALLLTGCPNNASTSPKGKSAGPAQPLTLIVVDDAPLGQAIVRQWRERTEEDLKLVEISAAEAEKAGRLPGDAIVFPTGLLGSFAEKGVILPLDNDALEDAEFGHRDIFTPLRMEEMRWGNRTFAVTLGSPRLLLAYRTDIFDKLQLKPPADWNEYQQLVEKLADRAALGDLAPADGEKWQATAEPLGDGWAGQLLMARAASYAMHRDQVSPLFKFDSLEPLIAEPPYRRALEELIAAAKAGGFAAERLSPTAAVGEVLAGRAAMAIGWPSPTDKPPANAKPVSFAVLPGAADAYNFGTQKWNQRSVDEPPSVPVLAVSGRLAAVTGSSAEPKRAAGFLVWLAGRDAGGQSPTASAATAPFRTSQVANPSRWAGSLSADSARQSAEALVRTMELPRTFPGPRLPGRAEYLAALDKAVQQAVAGEKPPADALTEAAARWREITKERGLAGQQRALARSLGQQSL